MADKAKTIDIIFGAIDKTGSAFSTVGGNLNALERNLGSVTAPLADITTDILKLDAAIAAAAVGLTAYGIKMADDFGTSFAEIATLIGEPAANLGDFKDQIQSYAEQSTASFEDITGATYSAISAGVEYGNSLDVIAQAETLSIAGRADLGITTKALVSTMNAFGAEMSEAGDYADVFFTTVQKGQTTLPELAATIGNVAPIAAQAGLSFDELGAAIAAVTAGAGVSTAEAMTALQAALNSIIKPSKEASDLAAKLGLDFNAAALESGGFAKLLDEVKTATNGNVEEMAQLFGSVRSLKAVLPLTGTAADDFQKIIAAMEQRTGAASKAAKELETDLGNLAQTLKNNVNSAFISFGKEFTDETAGIIVSLSNMFKSIGNEIKLDTGAFAPLIGQLEGVFQDIENKFSIVAANLPEALETLDFSGLIGAFDGLGEEVGNALRAIFGDIDITTVEGLESALQTVIDAFQTLVDVTSGIVGGLEPLFDLIGTGAQKFQDLSDSEKQSVGEMLGLATAINTVLPAVGALGNGMDMLGKAIITVAGVNGLKAIVPQLGKLSTLAAGVGAGGLIGSALFGAAGVSAAAGVGAGIGAAINGIFELFNDDSIGTAVYGLFNTDEMDDFIAKSEISAQRINEIKQAQLDAAEAQQHTTEIRELDIDALNEHAAGLVKDAAAEKERLTQADGIAAAHEKTKGALAGLVVGYDEVTGRANSWSGSLAINSKALDDNAEKTKEAIKQTAEYQLKLLEISSAERIVSIEANVELNIAQLEADTKTAVSIIETLGATITSTGDVLGSLFGAFNDASKYDQLAIRQQIELENKRRAEALRQQSQLTQAQIRLIQQKTAALARGDSIIQVEASNLAPALELIFTEILKETQLRANQEGLELLIGI